MIDSPDKRCARCGRVNPGHANFCIWCGSSEFGEAPPQAPEDRSLARRHDVALSIRRVVLLSVVSSGLYLFYWAYLTWAQLKSETGGDHYPGWHTLSLMVPIYGLFRLYRHIEVIKSLAVGAGLGTNLSPLLCTVLFFLTGAANAVSAYVDSVGLLLILSLVNTAVTTTLLVWAQGTLNAYWGRRLGPELRPVRVTTVEILVTVIGSLAWVALPLSV